MATVQYQLAELENGAARIVLEYDNVTLRAGGVRVYNGLPNPIRASIIRKAGRVLYAQEFPANSETMIPIPTTGGTRVDLGTFDRGRWSNIEFFMQYPA